MKKLNSEFLKQKEKEQRIYIEKDKHIVVRLDGRGFSKFTKKFVKPFDDHFSNAMKSAAAFVGEKFSSLVTYTQSDEITVVIPGGNEHNFSGRTDKLLSLMAATVTVKFYEELSKHYDISHNLPTFDARIMVFDNIADAVSTIINRLVDCRKNSIGMLSDYHFGHSKNMNKNTTEKLEMLMDSGIDWTGINNHFKYGTIIYKKKYIMEIEELDISIRNINGPIVRRKNISESFNDYSEYLSKLEYILQEFNNV
jgi:tRNA(His) 5'-end guanylyltransferase